MSAVDWVHAERQGIADDLLAVGPDAPTLCEGWTARDLAAHLHLRESRPDAAAGIVIGPLARWTGRVQDHIAERPYEELVEKVRTGPPRLSVFAIPGLEPQLNLVEFAVHREDVRRGQDGWTERDLDQEYADLLWGKARQLSRVLVRRSPVGLTFVRTDGAEGPDDPANRLVVRDEPPMVTVAGPAMEILLRLHGRRAVHLDVTGNEHAVRAFDNLDGGI